VCTCCLIVRATCVSFIQARARGKGAPVFFSFFFFFFSLHRGIRNGILTMRGQSACILFVRLLFSDYPRRPGDSVSRASSALSDVGFPFLIKIVAKRKSSLSRYRAVYRRILRYADAHRVLNFRSAFYRIRPLLRVRYRTVRIKQSAFTRCSAHARSARYTQQRELL